MVITEELAKKKWCPFIREFWDTPHGAAAVNFGGSDDNSCVASACMAWRRVETKSFKVDAEAAYRKSGERLISDMGYCGLAGKPEAE